MLFERTFPYMTVFGHCCSSVVTSDVLGCYDLVGRRVHSGVTEYVPYCIARIKYDIDYYCRV